MSDDHETLHETLVVDDATSEQPSRQILLTFLGFHGHKSCFDAIREGVKDDAIECIEASSQTFSDHDYCDVCQRIDTCYRKALNVHLGLGSIRKQARAASFVLERHGVTDRDKIVLLGHSQGALASVEFWNQFHEDYTIEGIVTMAAPLQGLSLIKTLGNVEMIREANQLTRTESRFCIRLQTYCFPYCIVPLFKRLGYYCFSGLTDMDPDSAMICQHREEVYEKMRTKELPFLAIRARQFAAAYAPSSRVRTDFLLSGSYAMPNDGLIATESQTPPGDPWDQLEVTTLQANHGMATVVDHPKIFNHPNTVAKVRHFCSTFFSAPTEREE